MERAMENGQISLEPQGKDFLLVRQRPDGSRDQMVLSENEVIAMIQSAPLWQDQIVQRYKPSRGGSVSPTIVAYHAAQIGLNTDLHKTRLLLTLYGQGGEKL